MQRPYKGAASHSKWPEADMLRVLVGSHVRLNHTSAHVTGLFPRADLGLPLKFQSLAGHTGSFGKAELSLNIGLEQASRLASPVIVKPVLVAGKWRPAMLLLNTPGIPAGDLRIDRWAAARPTTGCSGWPVSLWDGRGERTFGHGHSRVVDVLADYLVAHAGWTAERISAL